MRGRVKNLKNVYRTPSNIARCAFEILQKDSAINDYYKKSFYLSQDFISDIQCILQDGSIKVAELDEFAELKKCIKALPNGETSVVLSNSKVAVNAIKESVLPEGKNVEVLTIQSIKGLEAQNVIIHNFCRFYRPYIKMKGRFFIGKFTSC